MGFCTSFSYSIKRFSPLVFEPNTSIQKESLSRVFKSDFLEFFHYNFNPCFSHTDLSFPLLYHSYRRVVVRVILGDQSVVITKNFIFALKRRTCVFAWFRVLVRAHCRGAASASLRACGV